MGLQRLLSIKLRRRQMKVYTDLLLVAAITIYIVDLSGFTESWRGVIAKWLNISESALKPLPPFDCGKCATWWVCIIYSLCTGSFSLVILAYIALLSFLSIPLGQFFIFVREGLNWMIGKMIGWYE